MVFLLVVAVVVAVIFYAIYTNIVKNRNKMQEALSGIDVQLRKRHDLIPNVLKIAQRFMEHEKGLLEEITALRTRAIERQGSGVNAGDIKELGQIEAALEGKMSQLFVAVENYPDLKSDETMIQAQRTYSEVEEHIAAARRFYNSAVRKLHDSVQIFPGNVIAGMINIQAADFFEETSEAVRAPVDASNYLK
jgi:LemA protein